MRKKSSFWGIMAFALVFAMMVIGCDDDEQLMLELREKTPEEKSTADRWYSVTVPGSTVTITHSVANDGLVTVKVGGVAETLKNRYKACAEYEYTVQKDATYIYKFEAWTAPGSGNRTLTIEYYGIGWDTKGPPYLDINQVITEEQKEYTFKGTITGDPPAKSGVSFLGFLCADQLGTFYVKIISITQINSGDFIYSEDSSAITIIGYTGSGGNVNIPAEIKGKPVTAIGESAFYNNKLTVVTIPTSVTSIGKSAFEKNQLTSVAIGNNVTYIGEYAFQSNQLTSVTIGESVTYIGESAFESNQLTSVTIPNSVTEIVRRAFYNNPVTSVTIGANVTIGYMTFPGYFQADYDYEGKAAGTYTRESGSNTWTKQ